MEKILSIQMPGRLVQRHALLVSTVDILVVIPSRTISSLRLHHFAVRFSVVLQYISTVVAVLLSFFSIRAIRVNRWSMIL